MTRAEHVKALLAEYAEQRAKDEREQQQRLEDAVARQPEIGRLRQENADLVLGTMRRMLGEPDLASRKALAEETSGTAADMDEYGNIYELDESTGKAYLAKLKDNAFGGAFILPTSVDSGEDNYEVVGVRSGAIKDCNNLEKLFLHSGVTLLEDGSISDCASLKVLYFGTPKGVAVKIGEGNFTGLNEDFVILCSNVNATVMYNYVRTNSMAYAGLERNTLYFTSTKSAQKSYEPDEEFKPEGFNIIYVDENWDCHFIDKSELVFEYDFSVNNIVTVNYEDKTATYAVSLIG